jgi:hypothetical protein
MLRERDQLIALARDEGVTVTELAQRFEAECSDLQAPGLRTTPPGGRSG